MSTYFGWLWYDVICCTFAFIAINMNEKKNDSDEFPLSNLHSVGIDSTELASSCVTFINSKEFSGLKISLCFKILLTEPHNNQSHQLFCTRFFLAAVTDKFVLIFSFVWPLSLFTFYTKHFGCWFSDRWNKPKPMKSSRISSWRCSVTHYFDVVSFCQFFFFLLFKRLIGQA